MSTKRIGKTQMRRVKGKNFFVAFIRWFIIGILCIAVLGGAIFGITVLTDGYGGRVPLFSVTHRDKKYFSLITPTPYAESIGAIQLGEEFIVKSLFSDYEVKIYAKEADLSFTLWGEKWTWADVQGKDFTSAFTIEKTENGFILSFGNVEDILSAVIGGQVDLKLDEAIELFEMVISCRSYEYRFDFGVYASGVEGVELTISELII